MSRRWLMRTGAAVVVLASVLAAAPGGSLEHDTGPPLLEPPPELLIEAVPATRALRLQQLALRSTNFCDLLPKLDELGEPRPHDYDELVEWATRYHTLTLTYDPASELDDPNRRSRRIEPPDDITMAVAAERAAVYAYLQRLNYSKSLLDADDISRAEFNDRLDYAFQQLVRSPLTEADRLLVRLSGTFCGGG